MNNSSCSGRELFQSLGGPVGSPDTINRQLLRLLRSLYMVYPQYLDDPGVSTSGLEPEIREKIIAWLRSQRVVTVSAKGVALTLTGQQTLRKASRIDPQLKRFLNEEKSQGDPPDPSMTVLKILEFHFRTQNGRRTR